jgi:hypothetical protein
MAVCLVLLLQLSAQAQLVVHAEQQLADVQDEQRRLAAWSSELAAKEDQLASRVLAADRQLAELEAEKARYDWDQAKSLGLVKGYLRSHDALYKHEKPLLRIAAVA